MTPSLLQTNCNQKLLISTTTGIQFIPIAKVMYIESDNIYSKLHLDTGEQLIVLSPIKSFEFHCTNRTLLRIHKKYIVSMDKISLYSKSDGGYVCLENGIQLPVSRFKREKFLVRIGQIENL